MTGDDSGSRFPKPDSSPETDSRSRRLDQWLLALEPRHQSAFTSSEFLKALRALSARYVERRSILADRSPLDSAGKRAAFAAFYAPLHFLTTREVVRAAGASQAALTSIVDLGCGTGVASAAWAMALATAPMLHGADTHLWAIGEATWNWRQLGLRGDARRADLVDTAGRLLARRDEPLTSTGIIAGWSVNELSNAARLRLLPLLLELGRRGAAVLVIEPLARAAAPWWDQWAAGFTAGHGRAAQWKFAHALPSRLAALDEAAGFTREGLGARSLWLPPGARPGA